jgi:hypothetical protein
MKATRRDESFARLRHLTRPMMHALARKDELMTITAI